ncbi:hypothetical protein CHU98_g4778, partial [Xylaria longipes]
MVTLDRQQIIASNKSLRLIKNVRSVHPFPTPPTCTTDSGLQELEHLLENGVISDHVFDSILRQLPAESSLSGAPTPAPRTASVVSPPPAP